MTAADHYQQMLACDLQENQKFVTLLTGASGVVLEMREVSLGVDPTTGFEAIAIAPRVTLIHPVTGVSHRTLHPLVRVKGRI